MWNPSLPGAERICVCATYILDSLYNFCSVAVKRQKKLDSSVLMVNVLAIAVSKANTEIPHASFPASLRATHQVLRNALEFTSHFKY